MNEFFNWQTLITYAGACGAVGLITQFLDKLFPRLPTQVVAYGVALVVLLLGHAFTNGLTLSTAALCVFNAVIVAGATSGTISGMRRMRKGKEGDQAES